MAANICVYFYIKIKVELIYALQENPISDVFLSILIGKRVSKPQILTR